MKIENSKLKISPLIVVVGPTASGKSALALQLAQQLSGEIICADSRTIYKGMDVGTAKPSQADRSSVPHHILDVVTPAQSFTAAEFKRRALLWIDDIAIRGRVPIMAGGTGLYIDGVVFDYAFLPPAPAEEREQLQHLSVEQLQQKLAEQDIPLPKNSRNPRHLIRALETNGAVPIKKGLRDNTLIIGLDISAEVLRQRIAERVDGMLADGLESEVKGLADKFGWEAPGMSAVGYREWRQYFDGDILLPQVKSEIIKNTFQYAKRQRTWFKRNQSIQWVASSEEALRLAAGFYKKHL